MGLNADITAIRLRAGWDVDSLPDFDNVKAAGSEAPEALQKAWASTIAELHTLIPDMSGTCFYANIGAVPHVQAALGEPVQICAGYARFTNTLTPWRPEHLRDGDEWGLRWAPQKWEKWVARGRQAHARPTEDIHTWMETRTHVVDFSTWGGDLGGEWPSLIYWRKLDQSRLARHPRDLAPLLLWRSDGALEALVHAFEAQVMHARESTSRRACATAAPSLENPVWAL